MRISLIPRSFLLTMPQPIDIPQSEAHEMDFYIAQHASRHGYKLARSIRGKGFQTVITYRCEDQISTNASTVQNCPGFLRVSYTQSDYQWHITERIDHGTHSAPQTAPQPARLEPATPAGLVARSASPLNQQSQLPENTTSHPKTPAQEAGSVPATFSVHPDCAKFTISLRSTDASFETTESARLFQVQAILPLIAANKDLFPGTVNIHASVKASNGSIRDLDIIATSSTPLTSAPKGTQAITVSAAVSKHKPAPPTLNLSSEVVSTSLPIRKPILRDSEDSETAQPQQPPLQPPLQQPSQQPHSPRPGCTAQSLPDQSPTLAPNSSQAQFSYGTNSRFGTGLETPQSVVRESTMLVHTPAVPTYSSHSALSKQGKPDAGTPTLVNSKCSACHQQGHRRGSRNCSLYSLNKKSDLTPFHDLEGSTPVKKRPKCSVCGSLDHVASGCGTVVQLGKFSSL